MRSKLRVTIILFMCAFSALSQGEELPLVGTTSEECFSITKDVGKILIDNDFKAATFAAYSNGRLICNNALGYQDKELKKLISTDAKMRIASVGKPVAAILIKDLIRQGRISYTTKVFEYLETKPLGYTNQIIDDQVHEITIQNLIEHKLGWDKHHDGYAKETLEKIKSITGENTPTIDTIRRFMLTQKLQNNPGAKKVYSNFGYALIKEIIQKESGKPYIEYLSDFMRNYGVNIIESKPIEQRSSQEIWYDPESPVVEFTFAISAKDLSYIFTRFWINGDKRFNNNRSYTFYGSWDGTSAILRQRKDGITYSLLINSRGKIKNSLFKKAIDARIDKLSTQGLITSQSSE